MQRRKRTRMIRRRNPRVRTRVHRKARILISTIKSETALSSCRLASRVRASVLIEKIERSSGSAMESEISIREELETVSHQFFHSISFQGKKKDGNGSRSGTPTKEVAGKKSKAAAATKRKKESTPTKDGANQNGASTTPGEAAAPKRPKIELNLGAGTSTTPATPSAQQSAPLSQIDGVNEEAVRRYGIIPASSFANLRNNRSKNYRFRFIPHQAI